MKKRKKERKGNEREIKKEIERERERERERKGEEKRNGMDAVVGGMVFQNYTTLALSLSLRILMSFVFPSALFLCRQTAYLRNLNRKLFPVINIHKLWRR